MYLLILNFLILQIQTNLDTFVPLSLLFGGLPQVHHFFLLTWIPQLPTRTIAVDKQLWFLGFTRPGMQSSPPGWHYIFRESRTKPLFAMKNILGPGGFPKIQWFTKPRWEALKLFRAHVEGKGSSSTSLAVLVATDVAARGLDIPNISCHLGCRCLDDPLGSADWEKGCHLVGR